MFWIYIGNGKAKTSRVLKFMAVMIYSESEPALCTHEPIILPAGVETAEQDAANQS